MNVNERPHAFDNSVESYHWEGHEHRSIVRAGSDVGMLPQTLPLGAPEA